MLLLIFKIVEIHSQEGQTGHGGVPKNSCLLAYFVTASFSAFLYPSLNPTKRVAVLELQRQIPLPELQMPHSTGFSQGAGRQADRL